MSNPMLSSRSPYSFDSHEVFRYNVCMKKNHDLHRTTGLLWSQAAVGLCLFAATGLLSCREPSPQPSDWYEFTDETVAGCLSALSLAEADYYSQYVASDVDAACQAALERLNAHNSVELAGIAEDSTVWVFFKNGLLGSIIYESRGPSARAAGPAPVRISAGGEAAPANVIIAPFTQELPGTDPGPIPSWLDRARAADPVGPTEVVRDTQATVDRVKSIFQNGPGVLYWAGHGVLVPLDTSGPNSTVCALVTGEGYSDSAVAVDRIAVKYRDMVRPGARCLAVVRHRAFGVPPRFHLAILPAFVTAYGNFDRYEGQPANLTKSLAYVSCCYSRIGMSQAFRDKGVDVYWGWDGAAVDDYAEQLDRLMFQLLTDTSTAGEATDSARRALGNSSPPFRGRRAGFWMDGDSLCMVRAQMRLAVDGAGLRGYKVAVIPGQTVSVAACSTSTTGGYTMVIVNVPGQSPGTFDCAADDNAVISVTDMGTFVNFIVQKDYQGVSGEITVDRFDADRFVAHFSGTLGHWTSGRNPKQYPPDETMTVTNGLVKYTGRLPQD